MEKQRCKTHIRVLHGFLNSVRGNWRNSVYVECSVCRHGGCGREDFLYAPAEDGTPLLLPVPDAEIVFGRLMDKSECLGTVSNARFEDLFCLYLKKLKSGGQCPLLTVWAEQSKPDEF